MAEPKELKVISTAEVAKHCDKNSGVWLIIHNDIYDVTGFLEEHPGGEESLLDVAGKEATQDFEDVGHSDDARELMKKYLIGTLPPEEKNKSDKKTGSALTPEDKFNIPPCVVDYGLNYSHPERRFVLSSGSGSRSRCSLCSKASCPHLPRSTTEKTWRTYDGSPCSRSIEPAKSEYKPPTTPRPEGRVNAIYVPKERPRGRPCESGNPEESSARSNLKWAVIALAGALVLGVVLKKYLSK
ncbi:nitrate reductase [NADH] 2-like [Maniola jurtina]|uniref:nitrate reductase [NADH] 2-like n=1 Tax=Maniola jurtina TaxID=191418 RepID=UPI001E68C28F|nr:nitrate reductase [NADH] 2-like [Maniola jurtina]